MSSGSRTEHGEGHPEPFGTEAIVRLLGHAGLARTRFWDRRKSTSERTDSASIHLLRIQRGAAAAELGMSLAGTLASKALLRTVGSPSSTSPSR